MLRPHGFTLIELLVVISIIVVLLALLTPALDKALYESELVACGANQRGVGTSVQSYAMDFKRRYPVRPSIEVGYWNRPTNLSDAVVDDRQVLDGYLQMRALVDPLGNRVDLAATPENTHIFSSYNLWFGVKYTDEGTEYRGMERIGDRIYFRDRDTAQMKRFDILLGDYDSIWEYDNYGVFASHPDKDGVLTANSVESSDVAGLGGFPIASDHSTAYTLSRYQVLGTIQRGPMDLNFTYGDGSINRFEDVRWDEPKHDDAVMFDLPVQTRGGALGTGYPLYWDHVPLR